MPRYSALEQFQLKVLSKAASLVRAPSVEREVFEQFTMTVRAVTELHPHLRRITFRAGEFAGFRCAGPDECFGLLLPPAGRDEVTMPSPDRINVRQAIRQLPEHLRPDMRWYTIRAHRPHEQEIDVDIVVHGEAGPGSRWALAARPGQIVGFRAAGATYRPPPGARNVLLAADEAALPALSAILEAPGTDAGTVYAFVEVPTADYRLPIATEAPVTWLYRGTDPPGSQLLPAIRASALPTPDYAWLCGESTLATALRRHLVRDRSTDRRRILFSGYWKQGDPGA